MKKLLFGIAILAIAVMSQAQGGGRGFGMMQGGGAASAAMLLARDDVQAELALTDEQKDKIAALTDPQQMFPKMQKFMSDNGVSFDDFRTEEGRKKMPALMEKMQAEVKKEIDAVLTPAQSKRLGEIVIQESKFSAVFQKDVAKALVITEDQDTKLKALQKAQQDAQRGLGTQMRNQEITMEELQEKMKKNTEILNSEIGKILTDVQKAKLKEMGGKPFVKKDDGI